LLCIRLGDEVCELSMALAWAIAGDTADDLDDLGQRGPVANGQRMFSVRPIEPFLRHTEGEDDVCRITVLRRYGREIVECVRASLRVGVIDEIRDPQYLPGVFPADVDD